MTQEEKRAIEEFAKASTEIKQLIISNSLSAEIMAYNDGKYFGIKLGAEFLDELRNAEQPSEDLVQQIVSILDDNALGSGDFSFTVAQEIAKLFTQREAELLDALKKLISDINPKNACRGKFAQLGGSENSAYVGSKCIPSDESILNAIEIISKYEKP